MRGAMIDSVGIGRSGTRRTKRGCRWRGMGVVVVVVVMGMRMRMGVRVMGVGVMELGGIGGVARPARAAVVVMIRLWRLGSSEERLGRRWELRRCVGAWQVARPETGRREEGRAERQVVMIKFYIFDNYF
jgi:hypothetical protein